MRTQARFPSWPCALLLLTCGCRSAETARLEPPAPGLSHFTADAGVPPHPPADAAFAPDIELTSAETIDVSSRSTSLHQCISLSLAQNPDLIAIRQNDSVGSAALGVAQTYPFNPYVQVQVTPWQERKIGGPGSTYHYVLLMQTIQLAHQQQFREEGAASTLNSIRWNIHQAELLNVAQTERLYFSLLYMRGIHELAQASHDNNQRLLRTLEKQLEAGQASAADVAIVRVDARSTQQQMRLAQANHQTALRDLKRQLGMPSDSPLPLDGDLKSWPWKLPSLRSESDFVASDITSRAWSRPDVMAAQADVDAARAGMCLAHAGRTPDLQVGPYYQRGADGTTFLGLRAQMDLPVLNSGQPLEQQRIAELNQRVTAWQQLQRRAGLEAEAAWERYAQALSALTEIATEIGPANLPQELQSLEQRFLEGEVDVVRVVQARTSLIQSQRAHLDLLNELAQSAANLTAATGMSLEELLNDRE